MKSVTELFAEGIALEADPSRFPQAVKAYQAVVELEPDHAAAHINLGTLFYNNSDFYGAEKHYRLALAADSIYSLAWFDLGNVLDATNREREAIEAYRTAVRIAPTYADAHYNLALAYEKLKEPIKALKHWRAYVKLDPSSPWSQHARLQIKRIVQHSGLSLVGGNGGARSKSGTAQLFLVSKGEKHGCAVKGGICQNYGCEYDVLPK